MCGRYYADSEMFNEIEELVGHIDVTLRANMQNRYYGDIHPNDMAPVIISGGRNLSCQQQKWGFPMAKGSQIIFNARSESVLMKPMFRESILYRRAVIPAVWFYEWNKNKEKNVFYRKEQTVLYMAGCFARYQNENRFVILTTEANESMRPVHDRMPLILEKEEVEDWLQGSKTEQFLNKKPGLLARRTDYEQMKLFPE